MMMSPSTSDRGLILAFNQGCVAALPLGAPDKLGDPDFPIPVSYIYGETDWARYVDEAYSKKVAESQNGSHYHICPKAGH